MVQGPTSAKPLPTGPNGALTSLNLRDQAIAVIRNAVLTGEFAPGDVLSASSLAAQFGVSNSPIREALLALVEQGLMEPVRNRGFRVAPVSDHDRHEIYELRLMLEIPAMRMLAAMEISPHLDRFEHLVDELEALARGKDLIGYLQVDRSFHLGLLALLGNGRLVQIVGNLRDQTRLFGLHALAESGQILTSASEHRSLLKALQAGSADEAERIMRSHLEHIAREWAGREPRPVS